MSLFWLCWVFIAEWPVVEQGLPCSCGVGAGFSLWCLLGESWGLGTGLCVVVAPGSRAQAWLSWGWLWLSYSMTWDLPRSGIAEICILSLAGKFFTA